MTFTCPRCQAPIVQGQRFCRYCGSSVQRADQESIPTQTLGSNGSPSGFSVALGEESWGDRPVASWRSDVGTKSHRRWLVVVVVGLGMILGGWTVGRIIRQGIAARFPFQRSAPAVEVGRPYIGVHFDDEQDAPSGAFIDGVVAGSPADRAGLIGGDTIVQANGRPIRDARDFRRVLRSQGPGSLLTITFLRDGQRRETVLAVGQAGMDAPGESTDRPHGFLGFDPSGARRVFLPEKNIWGVRLTRILINRPADIAGLREGDIVIEFNGHPIRTTRELIRRINETPPYAAVTVKVVRDGQEMILPVKLGKSDE